MTRFWKDGHSRRNARGTTFWVEGHWVERYDWNRSSYQSASSLPGDPFLNKYPVFRSSRRVSFLSPCFVNPNAKCPVCGEDVYYYQNEHGSRVFFDELGPPWPKHGCTDTSKCSGAAATTQSRGCFEVRSQSAINEIAQWQQARGSDFAVEFREKHGTSPWPLATIAIRMKSGKSVFLVLKVLKEGSAKKVYLSCKSLPKCCQVGFLVAIKRQKISFVDTATMTPTEVTIKRFRSATAFLDTVIESDKQKT